MEFHYIKTIITKVFDKAKKECPSIAHTTLSQYIEAQSNPRISYKTAIRAYKKYIKEEQIDWSPNAVTVSNFCVYIGYSGYKDYVEKNDVYIIKSKTLDISNINTVLTKNNTKKKSLLYLLISVLIIVMLLYHSIKSKSTEGECMVWADTKYIKIDCDLQYHPQYDTNVIPDIPHIRKSMFKLENVDATTPFFTEITNKPLVWYYKTKSGTIEYFTSSGRHPVNGETLKKITEWIIEKYVPIHRTQTDSFIIEDMAH